MNLIIINDKSKWLKPTKDMQMEEYRSNIFDYKPKLTKGIEQFLMMHVGVFDPQIVLAINEALVNAAMHGNKLDKNKVFRFYYRVTKKNVLHFIVEDEGEGFNVKDVNDFLRSKDDVEQEEAIFEEYEDFDIPKEAAGFIALHEVTTSKEGHVNAGLGIIMMLNTFDKVIYNSKGNRVAGIKNLEGVVSPVF